MYTMASKQNLSIGRMASLDNKWRIIILDTQEWFQLKYSLQFTQKINKWNDRTKKKPPRNSYISRYPQTLGSRWKNVGHIFQKFIQPSHKQLILN